MKLLEGKVAVVTGAARGIGKAIALKFAQEGANIAFTDLVIDENGLATQAEIEALGVKAKGYASNAANFEETHNVVAEIVKDFGRIDILVNNAGATWGAKAEEHPLAAWDKVMDLNIRGYFLLSQAVARAGMLQRGGRIINIGSTNAERMPFGGGGPYAMSKAALVGLTKGLARDLGPRGITINNVQPGPVDTDMNPANSEFAESLIGLMAVGRYGHVEEIASFVAYLAGPEAGYITGASLTIDGGFSA